MFHLYDFQFLMNLLYWCVFEGSMEKSESSQKESFSSKEYSLLDLQIFWSIVKATELWWSFDYDDASLLLSFILFSLSIYVQLLLCYLLAIT